MVCEDCKSLCELLKDSKHYFLKKCCLCGKEEVVGEEIRFCKCGGQFLGWKSKSLNPKPLRKGR